MLQDFVINIHHELDSLIAVSGSWVLDNKHYGFAITIPCMEKIMLVKQNKRYECLRIGTTISANKGLYRAASWCGPKDSFNLLRGEKIAFGRALKLARISKEQRRVILEKYCVYRSSMLRYSRLVEAKKIPALYMILGDAL